MRTLTKNTATPAADNVLEYIPRPVAQWETDAEGLVVLKLPKFNNRLLQTHLQPRMKHPHISIQLDAYGTWVWSQMDGNKTVLEIGMALSEHFGETVEPVYQRLGMFINLLARRKFIQLQKK